jgi:hypothetical protein
MMPVKKTVSASLPVRIPLILCAMILACFGTASALGDLGIVIEKVEDSGRIEQCKYCGRFIKLGNIHKDAEVVVGNQLKKYLTEKGFGYQEGMRKAGYVNVLIYRFEERQGGDYAVDRPASIGMHLHLMEEKAVRRVFVFDESQQALSQNVFDVGKFFRRGGKWVTAEALSNEGVKAGVRYLLEAEE